VQSKSADHNIQEKIRERNHRDTRPLIRTLRTLR
jgi:hypothetical protein